MTRPRAAFTMLELLLAIALAVIILSLAIPTLGSAFANNALEDQYRKFEDFARKAQVKAMKEQRTIVLIWDKKGISMQPDVPNSEDSEDSCPRFEFGDAKLVVERPFALEKKPNGEWPFWRSGACEAVRIAYEGNEGYWVAEFDPMTARGTLIDMREK